MNNSPSEQFNTVDLATIAVDVADNTAPILADLALTMAFLLSKSNYYTY